MNITVNSTALAQELRLINQVVAAKSTLPILTNVLLNAHDHLYLYGTDLEVGFSTACRALVEVPGMTTLPAKRLLDLVEQLPDAEVQIINDGGKVRVISGSFASRLQAMPAEDFPAPVPVEGEAVSLSVSALQGLLRRIRFAISDKGTYVIKGALLTLTDQAAALVSTDGKRLSLASMTYNKTVDEPVLLPTKTVDALLGLFEGGELNFSRGERHLFFSSGHRLLISRTIDGKFPAYQRIIPNNEHKVQVNRQQLTAALRRIKIISAENQVLTLTFDAGELNTGELVLSTSSADIGEGQEQLVVDYSGPPVSLSLNGEFLLDFLEVAVEPMVSLSFQDGKTPIVIHDGPNFMNVIMLVRA